MPEFTETQQIAITEILGITRDSLTSRIVYLGGRVTQAVIDRVTVHLANWDDGIGAENIRVHPNVKNFGVEINPELAKEQIRAAIGNLLELSGWASSGNDEVYLERG